MPRELRKRTTKLNYAALLADEDDDEPGPSTRRKVVGEEPDSGSDFAPEIVVVEVENDEEDELSELSEVDEVEDAETHEEPRINKRSQTKRPAKKARVSLALTESASIPNLQHRHRAIPVYQRKGSVERLVNRPQLFQPVETAPTTAWADNSIVQTRIGKALGFNCGSGPVWELLEDRGWFSESVAVDSEVESARRPRVHTSVPMTPTWKIMSAAHAAQYIPYGLSQAQAGPHDGSIKCSFGPFGNQTREEMKIFSNLAIENLFPDTQAHVFNAGGPVWGIDWCPIHPDDRAAVSYKQFLAVSPLPSHTYSPCVGIKKPRPNASCIQVWALSPPGTPPSTSTTQQSMAHGLKSGYMRCELVLCIDSGPAHELQWCPLPSNDVLNTPEDHTSPRRLGLLAGAFEDGSLSIFAIPYPEDISRQDGSTPENDGPIYLHVTEPLLRFELNNTAFSCLDWANSEVLAGGCTNGHIAVYDIAEALRRERPGEPILPIHYFSPHQSAIRSISWIRAPGESTEDEITADDPTVIVSGGYDGLLAAVDLRMPSANAVYRTRDVISTVCYAPYGGGPVSIDQGQVKTVAFAPVMLNRGHVLTEPEGPVWSVHASDYHPQLAIGSADGSCLTTNMMRTTRRGGSVPFLSHKIYQLDYSRDTREWRMLEHFLPTEISKSAGAGIRPAPKVTAAWPPEVGIQRVVWNNGNGLGGASLLASATASGLCRVDWLTGKWHRDKIPYVSVEGIRTEILAGDEMDEDSD